jgi:hypothetical protein
MKEYSAQQRAALATVALLIDGPQRARELSHRLYDNEEGSWDMLNNIGGVVPLANDGGWWHVDIGKLADVAHLLNKVNERIDETCEGMAYCRPLTRKDMRSLQDLLRHVLKIGQPPE